MKTAARVAALSAASATGQSVIDAARHVRRSRKPGETTVSITHPAVGLVTVTVPLESVTEFTLAPDTIAPTTGDRVHPSVTVTVKAPLAGIGMGGLDAVELDGDVGESQPAVIINATQNIINVRSGGLLVITVFAGSRYNSARERNPSGRFQVSSKFLRELNHEHLSLWSFHS